MRAGSISPPRRRNAHHRSSPSFEPTNGARNHIFSTEREPGRYRDYSPPYGRGKDGGRFPGRGYDRSARGPGSFRVDSLPRNNPNVRPREGDWICSDPSCKNLNFARRDHCNNCNRPRYASLGSPRRGYPGATFPPRQRIPPPLHHPPLNGGYRSPPHGWPRDDPRDFRPPSRNDVRFLDPIMHGERPDDVPRNRDRDRFDRPLVPEWGHRDRGRDNYFFERRGGGHGRRVLSPPPIAPRGWGSHIRDKSRSPVRGDVYMNRRRDDRRAAF
ncbi:hypothetical protein ACS0TY_021567 [Phlomoides rotata]